MRFSHTISRQARYWVSLSLDHQRHVCLERVRAVLTTLASGKKHSQMRLLLKAYQYYIKKQIRFYEGKLEHAGQLNADMVHEVQANVSARLWCKVQLKVDVVPTLIAGLRVTLGDHVWEDTVASRLQQFTHSF